MINIQNKVTQPVHKMNMWSLNKKTSQPLTKDTVFHLNIHLSSDNTVLPPVTRQNPYVDNQSFGNVISPAIQQGGTTVVNNMIIPALQRPLQKGQKALLNLQGNNTRVKACFGWNVNDQRCDIDVSAFLVTVNGKVPSDDWFVFYGQEISPDCSVKFQVDATHKDREIIDVDFACLNPNINRVVFVMTINEAFQRNLNFSMIKDAYIRILDVNSQSELLSYRMDQYYANVTSMTIGELYKYNGMWKFNAVGNGVHQDLAGQCAIYGVEIC